MRLCARHAVDHYDLTSPSCSQTFSLLPHRCRSGSKAPLHLMVVISFILVSVSHSSISHRCRPATHYPPSSLTASHGPPTPLVVETVISNLEDLIGDCLDPREVPCPGAVQPVTTWGIKAQPPTRSSGPVGSAEVSVEMALGTVPPPAARPAFSPTPTGSPHGTP